ncbi:hypothetical protein GCM10009560_42130 [Nonomuraea longicatena]|uniref:Heavy metal-binding domain-containing protein n=2 Tax=Nonomuraea longicatena TaxID=83682 RepID=A0ABP4ACN8_9ACTN
MCLRPRARGYGERGTPGKDFGSNVQEFVAIGTAVKADEPGEWRDNKDRPFTSALSGQDFWTLIRAGYAPLGMVMGTCIYHIAHRSVGSVVSTVGTNVEISEFTQALYNARELAMARMQAEAKQLGAEGIVGVELDQHHHEWGPHTMEFFAIGTAIRPLRDDHRIERPQMVLGLDR